MAAETWGPIDYDEEPGGAVRSAIRIQEVARAARRGGTGAVARALRVRETMTTSDFAHLADQIDVGVMAGYLNEVSPICYTTLGRRRDTVELARAGGLGEGKDYTISAPRRLPRVAEKGEYKPLDVAEAHYHFRTYKYGGQFDLSWEAWLNDQRRQNLLGDYPASWGLSARDTQQALFTEAYAANAVLFTAAQGNYMAGAGSQLDYPNLDIAVTAITNFTDPSGNILTYGGNFSLVVPPALESTARRLVDPSWLIANKIVAVEHEAMGAWGSQYYMGGKFQVVVDQHLPAADLVTGNTAWYIFCNPALRPAMRYGFLQGYEATEIWVKSADAQALASGAEDPFGSFLNDDIAFKCRMTFGADPVDWRGAYMSTGQASQ